MEQPLLVGWLALALRVWQQFEVQKTTLRALGALVV
jgi:predicted nucleotidyltransferase